MFIIPIVVYYIMPLYLAVAFRLLFFGRLTMLHLLFVEQNCLIKIKVPVLVLWWCVRLFFVLNVIHVLNNYYIKGSFYSYFFEFFEVSRSPRAGLSRFFLRKLSLKAPYRGKPLTLLIGAGEIQCRSQGSRASFFRGDPPLLEEKHDAVSKKTTQTQNNLISYDLVELLSLVTIRSFHVYCLD